MEPEVNDRIAVIDDEKDFQGGDIINPLNEGTRAPS